MPAQSFAIHRCASPSFNDGDYRATFTSANHSSFSAQLEPAPTCECRSDHHRRQLHQVRGEPLTYDHERACGLGRGCLLRESVSSPSELAASGPRSGLAVAFPIKGDKPAARLWPLPPTERLYALSANTSLVWRKRGTHDF